MSARESVTASTHHQTTRCAGPAARAWSVVIAVRIYSFRTAGAARVEEGRTVSTLGCEQRGDEPAWDQAKPGVSWLSTPCAHSFRPRCLGRCACWYCCLCARDAARDPAHLEAGVLQHARAWATPTLAARRGSAGRAGGCSSSCRGPSCTARARAERELLASRVRRPRHAISSRGAGPPLRCQRELR